jgi:hypothetical protein
VHVDLGYDTTDLLTASVYLPERYRSAPERLTFYSRVVDGLRESPAIDGVLVRENIAAIGDVRGEFDIDAVGSAAAHMRPRAYVLASLGALGTIGVNVIEGRAFDARDGAQGEQTVIASQALAQRLWPGQSPLGRRVRLTGTDSAAAWRVVVGVVDNVLYGNPISRDRSADALYIPLLQSSAAAANVAFRHRGDEAAAQSAFQRTIALVDPLVMPPTVTTYAEMLSKTSLIAASTAKLFGSCFLFALLLAVSGTYGLMARWIGQRTREIGVRRALGASDATVTRLLLGQGGRQLGMGVVIAVPVMVAVGLGFWRFVPIGWTVSAVAGVLVCATIIAVVLLASYFPTRRVLRVALRDALWRD